jgi:hypothetical protein
MAINQPTLALEWDISPFIKDVKSSLLSFSQWSGHKVSKKANSKAHLVAKWTAFNNYI